MTDGQRVKAIRVSKDLTLEAFGAKIGVGKSTISDIENGRRALTNQSRLSICREFGVSERWLRDGEGEMFAAVPHDLVLEAELRDFFSAEPEPFREAFVRVFLRLPSEHWDILRDYVVQLAAEAEAARQAQADADAAELARQIIQEERQPDALSAFAPDDGKEKEA